VTSLAQCPVCQGSQFRLAVRLEEIQREIELRESFVRSRLEGKPSLPEAKDLLDFMHGDPAALFECSTCGLLTRAESESLNASTYEEDVNDPVLMRSVYPRYLAFFRKKERALRDLLPPRARVLELGSHLGAFLQAAEEWTWRATGLDVGRDTTAFARSQGLHVLRDTIEDARLPSREFDAVFIWNCFEQIPDPQPMLALARRVLKPHGLLIVRVPNAHGYKRLRTQDRATPVLAYNNLLGFPYLFGYTERNLRRLLAGSGFGTVRGFDSELITMPFPDRARKTTEEQREISRFTATWSRRESQKEEMAGPWIELIARKNAEPRRVPPGFLPRAA
jgi:SAM-dependent methyltransferase